MEERADMEEKVDVMTDNQWDGMIKMFMMMVWDTDSKEELLQKLKLLLNSEDEGDRIIAKMGFIRAHGPYEVF